MELTLAPLKGYTDEVFRNAYALHFDGFDSALAPFLPTVRGRCIRPVLLRGLRPENNRLLPVVPQVMSNSPDDFVRMAHALAELGHGNINWNLGCPFPMVAKKGKGSGMLPHPDRIDRFLDRVVPRIPVRLSVKIRLGRKGPNEIFQVLPVLNRFPLSEVIIHPRTASQMYSGRPDLERFSACLSLSRHPIVYNGDINCVADFRRCSERYDTVKKWMIGRGALVNPFLPEEIRGSRSPAGGRVARFRAFYQDLFEGYRKRLSGPGHLLDRMKGFWTYLALGFEGGRRLAKQIHRSKHIGQYETIVSEFFKEDPTWAELPEGASIHEML